MLPQGRTNGRSPIQTWVSLDPEHVRAPLSCRTMGLRFGISTYALFLRNQPGPYNTRKGHLGAPLGRDCERVGRLRASDPLLLLWWVLHPSCVTLRYRGLRQHRAVTGYTSCPIPPHWPTFALLKPPTTQRIGFPPKLLCASSTRPLGLLGRPPVLLPEF